MVQQVPVTAVTVAAAKPAGVKAATQRIRQGGKSASAPQVTVVLCPGWGGGGRGVAPNCQSTPQYGVPPTKTRTPPTNNTRDGSYTNNPTPGSARNLLLLHRLRGTRQVHAPSPYHRPDDCPSRSLESVFDDCLLEPTDALMDTSTGTSMAASTAASTAAPAGASTGALRRRNVPLAKMQGIPVAAIRRLARRGGVNDSRSSVAASGSSLRK